MRRAIILALIVFISVPSMLAQTYFEPAAGDVFHPNSRQRGVAKSTDVAVIALPAAALVGVLAQKDWQGLLQGVETAGATAAATLILKYSVNERRPDGSNMHSFPSGHSSISFATAGFLQRRYGWKVGAPAYALACYVGWGRVYAKKHHWWDVIAGGAIGAGCAYIFTTPFAKKHNLSLSPVYDGHTAGLTAYMEF